MKRKNKSLIILTVILVVITLAGGIYAWGIQGKELKEKGQQLTSMRANYANIEAMDFRLKELESRVTAVDSLLFSGSFTLPQNLPQSDFYKFVDSYSGDSELFTFTNTEYVNRGVDNGFHYYAYKVSGIGAFENVYGLIYAIEHSKELKKIQSSEITGMTSVDSRGVPRYLVKFSLDVKVYFSESDQYSALTRRENNLTARGLHNAFYPLVRNEIRRNTSNLPDVQKATLMSLVPQGAFITDSNGNTLLLKKGDLVYLGYLAEIDYENETVTFTMNKGGIVEDLTLEIGKKHNKQGRQK
jgi:hypothetical protein